MYGNLTMGNFLGDKFISDQGNEFTIVENNSGQTFDGMKRAIMQCDILNRTAGAENGYDVRVKLINEVLTKAPVSLEDASNDPEKVVDDPIKIDFAWVSGGYLNMYVLFEIQYNPKKEGSTHMINLVYNTAEVGTGKYAFTLRHNSYGETLAGKEDSEEESKDENQVQTMNTDLIQWGIAGAYVSFQLSDIITEEEAELTIDWTEHLTDPLNNWLSDVTSKSSKLLYSKKNFEQAPLTLKSGTKAIR